MKVTITFVDIKGFDPTTGQPKHAYRQQVYEDVVDIKTLGTEFNFFMMETRGKGKPCVGVTQIHGLVIEQK